MPTQEERDRAMAVHSLDDQTRVRAGGDETETVMGAGGEIQPPPQPRDDEEEPVMTDRRPPMDPDTDEASERQLDLAHAQGAAYSRALAHMAQDVADDGGQQRAGEYVVGYAVEEAEGMYAWSDGELSWQGPGETNAHVEVSVQDGSDGRFVPCLDVTVTMVAPDGTQVGPHPQPMLWHPMIYHYGRNWTLPSDGTYTMRVHIDPPTFMRHDEVNGRRFTEPVDVEFTDVRVTRGQD